MRILKLGIIRRLTLGIFVATLAVTCAAGVAAPSANAGECSFWLCGNVTNRDDSSYLRVTTAWGDRENQSKWRWLKPGQDGPDIRVKDVDGFYLRYGGTLGWIRRVGPGWYKVRDGQNIQVTDIR